MAQNYLFDGDVLVIKNATGSTITSGSVVIVNILAVVALVDIADGESGACASEGVFELTKDANLVIAQGEQVYWNTTNKEVTKTVTDKPLGFAAKASAASDTTVEVSICNEGKTGVAANQANSTASNVAGIVADFNSLLAKLQAAGLMAGA